MKRYLCLFVLLTVATIGCSQDTALIATGTIYGDLLYPDGTPASDVVVLVEGTGLSAVSDENGRFIIDGVLAVDRAGMGKYYTVRGHGMQDGVSMGFILRRFKVKGQQSYSIGVAVVRQTGTITGTIMLEGTVDHSGTFVGIKGTSLETVTRANGEFVLDRVPAGVGFELPCDREGYAEMTILHYGTGGGVRSVDVEPARVTDVGNHLMLKL